MKSYSGVCNHRLYQCVAAVSAHVHVADVKPHEKPHFKSSASGTFEGASCESKFQRGEISFLHSCLNGKRKLKHDS